MRNRGRFQAQGDNLEKSESWAKDEDITKPEGINYISSLEQQLTPAELNVRNIALQRARQFVNSCPGGGVGVLKKTFKNNAQSRSVRVDVEVNAGIAFIN